MRRRLSSSPFRRGFLKWIPYWFLIGFFCLVTISLVSGGIWFYKQELRALYNNKFNQLHSVTLLKTNEILKWREERISDARMNAADPFFRPAVELLLADPEDLTLRASILTKMTLVMDTHRHQNIILAGVDGRLLFSIDPRFTSIEEETHRLIDQVVAEKGPVFGDFFRSPATDHVYLDVAAPILDSGNRPIAVLILRSDPDAYLYPLIQTWPTASQTAETLLVRREGSDITFLSTLRHSVAGPLSFRIPLSKTDVPAVQAVLGKEGRFEGYDYRGVSVLSYLAPIPGTPWFMVAEMDREETLTEARWLGFTVLLFVILSVLLTTAVAAYLVNNRQRLLYQQLFKSELERRLVEDETRTTLYSIGDGVIATGRDCRITRMNPIAEELTGWKEAEGIGQPLSTVFQIINEETRAVVENPAARVLKEGLIVGLANHTILIARDGSEHPIADSGAPIRDSDGQVTGAVLVFRDQTEERRMLRALADSEERFSKVFHDNPAAILLSRLSDGTIIDVNGSYLQMFGYKREDLIGHSGMDLDIFEGHQNHGHFLQKLLENGFLAGEETTLRIRSGEIKHVLYSIEKMKWAGEDFLITTLQDITRLKQVEEQLRQSQAELKTAQAMARIGSWRWNLRTNHFSLSDEMVNIFDIDLKAFSGDFTDLLAQRIHPDDHKSAEQMTRAILNHEHPAPCEFRVILPDQSLRVVWAEVGELTCDNLGAPLELSGIFQDITARKRAEQELYHSQERYRYLVELSPDAVFVFRDNRIEFINSAALGLFGASSSDQVIGKSPYDIIHPDYHAIIHERIQRMAKTGEPVGVIEEKIIRFDGSWRDVEVAAAPFTDTSGLAIQVIMRDISERKQAELQLSEQIDELRRWRTAMLGRETRVLELKNEVNKLLLQLGLPSRYASIDLTPPAPAPSRDQVHPEEGA